MLARAWLVRCGLWCRARPRAKGVAPQVQVSPVGCAHPPPRCVRWPVRVRCLRVCAVAVPCATAALPAAVDTPLRRRGSRARHVTSDTPAVRHMSDATRMLDGERKTITKSAAINDVIHLRYRSASDCYSHALLAGEAIAGRTCAAMVQISTTNVTRWCTSGHCSHSLQRARSSRLYAHASSPWLQAAAPRGARAARRSHRRVPHRCTWHRLCGAQ